MRQIALAKGTCPLNHEQQQVLVGVARWFRYLNGLCPFGSRKRLLDSASGHEHRRFCAGSGSLCQPPERPLESSSPYFPWRSKDAEGKGATVASPASENPVCHIRSPSDEGEYNALFDAGDGEVNVSPFSDVLGATDLLDKEATSPASVSLDRKRSLLRPSRTCRASLSASYKTPKLSFSLQPVCYNPVDALHRSETMASGCLQEDGGAVLKASDSGPRSARTQKKSGLGCSVTDSTASGLTEPPRSADPTEPLTSAAASMPACSAPVLLVQGVFGAGKSTLLAACLATLCR